MRTDQESDTVRQEREHAAMERDSLRYQYDLMSAASTEVPEGWDYQKELENLDRIRRQQS